MKVKVIVLLCVFFSICGSSFSILAQSSRKINREGIENYKKGEFDKAEKDFKNSFKTNPDLIEASYNLALSYYRQEKYSQAVAQLKYTLGRTSDQKMLSAVHFNMGNSYLRMNKLKEGIEAYQNSLRINPNDEEARYNLTYALLKLKASQKEPPPSKNLMNDIENEENSSQKFMRRNKNLGKKVKNW